MQEDFTDYMRPLGPLVLALCKTLLNPEDYSQVTHENWIAIFKNFLATTKFDDDPSPTPVYEDPPPFVPSPKSPRNIPRPWAAADKIVSSASATAATTDSPTQPTKSNEAIASPRQNTHPYSGFQLGKTDDL